MNNIALNDYVIREVKTSERKILVKFLELYFFPREYIFSSYVEKILPGLSDDEVKNLWEYMRLRHEVMLENLPCLVAVNKETEDIIGMALMAVEKNPRIPDLECTEQSLIEILTKVPERSKHLSYWFTYVLEAADDKVDLFEKFPHIQEILKLIIICVDPDHSSKGISTKLISQTIEWSKKRNVDLISGLFTSSYSKRAAEKNGFEILADIDIRDLKDGDDNVIYERDESYLISVMAKKL